MSTLLGLALLWGVGYLFASRVVGEDRWERLEDSPLNYSIVMAVGFAILLASIVLTTVTYTLIVDGRRGLRLLPLRRKRRA